MNNRKLKDFYVEFFNGHMFRDIDYIRGKWYDVKSAETKERNDRLRYTVKNLGADINDISRFKKNARFFLLDKKHRDGTGQLVHHNSYFKNVPDFHSVNNNDRQYDRLFFDIDKHDNTIDGFKNDLKRIKGKPIGTDTDYTFKQKLKDIKGVQKNYRNYLIKDNDGDFLHDPFNDAMNVIKYYHDRGVNPVLSFTGGAGFHINTFFNPVHLINPSDVFLSYTKMISNKTGVPIVTDDMDGSGLDDAPPKNAVIGTQRTAYSIHEKSGLTGFIIPDDTSYDDFLTMIKRNKPQVLDFSYDDHLIPELLQEQIINMDKKASKKKQEKQEQVEQSISNSNGYSNKIYLDGQYIGTGEYVPNLKGNSNILSSDLRQLWNIMVLDGKCHPVESKDIREHYNRVRCSFPDHEDRTPSAICSKYSFKCFKCCPDGINWYMLIAVTYGIVKPDDIKKNMSPQQKQEMKKVIRKLMDISKSQ